MSSLKDIPTFACTPFPMVSEGALEGGGWLCGATSKFFCESLQELPVGKAASSPESN